ncbi:MAG: FAD-linked oxidase C-terminal domain-containing protein [Polyangiaceae bacterium]
MSPLAELLGLLGDSVVTDLDVIEGYRRDQASWGPVGMPLAVVRPKATDEVQQLARWATQHRIALVPRGAGTGVAGGAGAVNGCVTVSFERMRSIIEVSPAGMYAIVQPGVLNVELKQAAAAHELWYPPDPSSFEISTLGGNVATNAGGLCCLKYGVTGDYVLGLEAVLADGQRFRTGGRCRKDVAGYDLTRLLVGSEGTLALITEITLRLRRRPRAPSTLVALFDSLEASGHAVAAIVRAVDPSMLEVMDRAAIAAVESFAHLGVGEEAAAMLIAQTDSGDSGDLSLMRQACEANGAQLAYVTEDEDEGRLLLKARRLAYPALESLGAVVIDDVSVPLPQLAEMFRRIEAAAARSELMVATVAHAGDGNIHPLIVFDPEHSGAKARAITVFEELLSDALELGGTITGEHGVGTLKAGFLPRQLAPTALNLHHGIKHAFDPLGIMNPGKVLTPAASYQPRAR